MAAFEDEPNVPEKRRIRYDDDEEDQRDAPVSAILAQYGTNSQGPRMSRTLSTGSQMSIRSTRSMTSRAIDPTLAVPIQYRTLSFHINEAQEDVRKAQATKNKAAEALVDVDWHSVGIDELFRRLSSSTDGLSSEQVKRALIEFGPNKPSRPPSNLPRKLFFYFFGGFSPILLVGSILVFVSWKPLGQPPAQANLALAVVLAAVFFVQAAFNAWQDYSSSRVMSSITGMLPDNCLILRNGRQEIVMATDVVPGDIVTIKLGNKLPADVRFLEATSDAKFDRSILTGESMPIAASLNSTDGNYLETRCIGLQGTHCISGNAVGIVVATGDETVFGRIAKLTNNPNTTPTALERDINRFVLIIGGLMLAMNIIVLIVWGAFLRVQHPDWISVPGLIVNLVSVAIAFVPEGLPIAFTTSLTITAKIMRQNKILCKSLKTVETLGTVSVLCSDKTGTLTKNQMTASDCCIGTKTMSTAEAVACSAADEVGSGAMIQQLRVVAGICNAGEFDVTTMARPLAERVIMGDATDQAVLRFSESIGPVQDVRRYWRKRFDLSFNSKNKFMLRVSSLEDPKGLVAVSSMEASAFGQADDMLLTIKGGPDVLIGRCEYYVSLDGTTQRLDPSLVRRIEEIKDTWSAQGKRVILLARKILPGSVRDLDPAHGDFEQEATKHAQSGLTLVGLIGIMDPPRPEIPEVVRVLRRAGIRIFMVTGDFKLTAQAIAHECGIMTTPANLIHGISNLSRHSVPVLESKEATTAPPPTSNTSMTSITLSGPEIITLNEHQWDQLCKYEEVVFARTTPEQKLRIVKEYQARENRVAMTGDGVNDAPSLKQADIGIAPGSGSDIAIEAADMVLLESFSAIVQAVLYGRVVFDNLKKIVAYLLPAGSFSEFWPVMTSVLLGLPQVLSSFLMIVICCFTDCAAAIALSLEQPEADVMLRPPRNPRTDKLVDWRLLLQAYGFLGVTETLCAFAMAYWYAQRNGVPFSVLVLGYGNLPDGLTQDQVTAILNTASSIYFVNLVVMQWFALMAIRTRSLSIFQHPPAFNRATQNLWLFPAIGFSLVVAFIFLYVPPLQSVLGSTTVPIEHWLLPVAFGLALLALEEARKASVRRWPEGFLARIAW